MFYTFFIKVITFNLLLSIGFSFTGLINVSQHDIGKSNCPSLLKQQSNRYNLNLRYSKFSPLLLKSSNQFSTSDFKIRTKQDLKTSNQTKARTKKSRKAYLQNLLLGVGVSSMLKIPAKDKNHNFSLNDVVSSKGYIANAVQDPKRSIWISGKSIKEKGDTDRTGTKKDIKYLRCLSNCTSDCKKPGASIDTSDNQSCLEQCQDQCCETYEQCTYKLQKE